MTTVLNYIQSAASYLIEAPAERERAERSSVIDFAIHPIVMSEQQLAEIPRCVAEHGVRSFKYFANFKGDEGAYMGVAGNDTGFFYALCREVARHPDVVLAVHPENIETIWRITAEVRASGRDAASPRGRSRARTSSRRTTSSPRCSSRDGPDAASTSRTSPAGRASTWSAATAPTAGARPSRPARTT